MKKEMISPEQSRTGQIKFPSRGAIRTQAEFQMVTRRLARDILKHNSLSTNTQLQGAIK